jgi:hypothetical protein
MALLLLPNCLVRSTAALALSLPRFVLRPCPLRCDGGRIVSGRRPCPLSFACTVVFDNVAAAWYTATLDVTS